MTGILPIQHKTQNNQLILDQCKLRYWYVPFYFSAINSQLIWRNDVHVHLIHELNTMWHHLFNFQQQKFSLLVNPLTTKMLFLLITWTNNPTQECFTHMETSSLRVKSCTFWPMLSTRGHWAVRVLYRAYWDTGHPLIMVIPEDPWHTHQLPSVWLWNCQYLFLRLRFVVAGIRTPNHPHARLQHANPLRHCCGPTYWEKNKN